MEQTLKVSVVVPVYNTARYLRACIEGLLGQDLEPSEYEILLVDNNSTDASVSIAERYPRVRLLHEPKQGSYAARNRGVSEAKADIIAFTDSDCVPERDWLRECLAGLAPPEVDIVVGHAYFDPHSWWMKRLTRFEAAKEAYALGSEDPRLYYGHTNNLAARRAALDAVGGFVEWARGGDTIFVQQTLQRSPCEAVVFRPTMRVRHLEVDSVGRYYQKAFTYGRSQRRYRRVVGTRSLSIRERLRVFDSVTKRDPIVERMALLAVLSAGLVPWWAGIASALGASLPGPPPPRPTSCSEAPEA